MMLLPYRRPASPPCSDRSSRLAKAVEHFEISRSTPGPLILAVDKRDREQQMRPDECRGKEAVEHPEDRCGK